MKNNLNEYQLKNILSLNTSEFLCKKYFILIKYLGIVHETYCKCGIILTITPLGYLTKNLLSFQVSLEIGLMI